MGTIDITPKKDKWKQLSEVERHKIEAFLKAKWSISRISLELCRDRCTISREIKRGTVKERNSDLSERVVYRAEHSGVKRAECASNKGRPRSVIPPEIHKQIVLKMRNNYSPDAVIGELRASGVACICTRTLYNHLNSGFFTEFPFYAKRQKRKKKARTVSYRNTCVKRIDERPEEANKREPGHWEMDTVVSGKGGKGALLVLTERHSRFELIFLMNACTQAEVIKVMDRLERRFKQQFRNIFKSITPDNGGEFLDFKAIEKSIYGEGKRTTLYYARPYASYQRGSNENANKLIRKWIKKGEDISKYTVAYIKKIQNWMNNYPRKMFNYKTAKMLCKTL